MLLSIPGTIPFVAIALIETAVSIVCEMEETKDLLLGQLQQDNKWLLTQKAFEVKFKFVPCKGPII